MHRRQRYTKDTPKIHQAKRQRQSNLKTLNKKRQETKNNGQKDKKTKQRHRGTDTETPSATKRKESDRCTTTTHTETWQHSDRATETQRQERTHLLHISQQSKPYPNQLNPKPKVRAYRILISQSDQLPHLEVVRITCMCVCVCVCVCVSYVSVRACVQHARAHTHKSG